MHTLLIIQDLFFSAIGLGGDLFLAATRNSGQRLANALRDFVGPILLLIVSFVALTFLFRRQISQFAQFIALAIGIAVLFYYPGIIEDFARVLKNMF